MSYLARAKRIHSSLDLSADDLDSAQAEEVRRAVAAVRVSSRSLGEVWICKNDEIAQEIASEGDGLPILTFAEVVLLRGKTIEMKRAILAAKAGLGQAWMIQ